MNPKLKVLLLVLCVSFVSSKAIVDHDEDLNLSDLFGEDGSSEVNVSQDNLLDEDEIDPVYLDEMWRCGNCDEMEKMQLIYSETSDVNFVNLKQQFEMRVELAVPGMRCITITGDKIEELEVERASGACSGSQVILDVKPHDVLKTSPKAQNNEDFFFIANVYGY